MNFDKEETGYPSNSPRQPDGANSNPYGSPASAPNPYGQPGGNGSAQHQQYQDDYPEETVTYERRTTTSAATNVNRQPNANQQPNYGQPVNYGQQPNYGQQYGQPYGQYNQLGKDKSNMAIVFGVLGLVIQPLIFGILGFLWVKKANELGEPATAGRVLATINIGLTILGVLFFIFIIAIGSMSSASGY